MSSSRPLLTRRRLLVGSGLVVAVAAGAVAAVDPFAGAAASGGNGIGDNAAPTSLATVERRSLVAQTPVSGTLGYAGTWTVAVPAGTAPSSVQQARQAVASAEGALVSAESAAAADGRALAQAEATLRAAQLKEATDCAGSAAAPASGGGEGSSGGAPAASPCAAAMQAVASDQASLAAAAQKPAADRTQLAGARSTLAGAQQALAEAEASASSYGSAATFTMLPTPGAVVRRGGPLYAVDGRPTLLLIGSVPAWRAFRPGMSPGRDVAELNANLRALGYDDPLGDRFTSATARAISALRSAHGLEASGVLELGSVVFEPQAVRVTTVTPTVGQAVQPGPVLTASSTAHDVSIQLDAAQQSEVKVGDRVTVTLPDGSTTPGEVSSVGKVATAPAADQGNGPSTPTIDVDVRLLHAAAAGTLDQAPVQVSITTASVSNVLVVPVDALIALAGGGYAVEETEPDGTHRLEAVAPGLFDDNEGLVQVSGTGLAAGQRVVVPASA
jgi:hypothetical protein